MPSCPDEKEPPKRAFLEERLVNADQRSLVLDFLKCHTVPLLQDNVDPILWTVLVQKLNAIPGGIRYTSEEWKEGFQANVRLFRQQAGVDVPQNGDVEKLPKRGSAGTIWRIVEEPSKTSSDKDNRGSEPVVGSEVKVSKDSLHMQNQASASSGTASMEQILMKKLIKSDSIKIRYLKRKLKMEGQFRKNKLSLMRDMLLVKQRKVKVEEKQATALLRIARSLDKLLQSRRLEQF
ncbi:hypothetical protein YQE_04433, partial [Dendroctonus ponderosae]